MRIPRFFGNVLDKSGPSARRDCRLKEAPGGTSKGHQADYPGSRRSCGDRRRESSVQKDASSRLAATPLASSARCMKATCHCGGAFRFTKERRIDNYQENSPKLSQPIPG